MQPCNTSTLTAEMVISTEGTTLTAQVGGGAIVGVARVSLAGEPRGGAAPAAAHVRPADSACKRHCAFQQCLRHHKDQAHLLACPSVPAQQ